ALHYLERYASSTDNLRRVLQRRTDRSARLHGTDRDEAAGWIDAIVGRLTAAGLLDDRAYAETRAASLQRHGASRRKIAGMLQQKGVDADTVAAALEALERDLPSPDLDAAIRFARRRRLGPWRPDEKREERRERDLAALARAGFSYSLAHRIVDADSVEALEDALFEQ
ncbi:MAG: RecX family transcriptional regulator, partial [Alphaproteobacteria bacterium]